MRVRCETLAAALTLWLLAAPAQGQQTEEWTFSGIERIEIDGVSGDLRVEATEGSELRLSLRQDVQPRGAFHADVRQQGTSLHIRERWDGSGSSSGGVDWSLEVPAALVPMIVFRTSSGDLEAWGTAARFRFKTSSGDITLQDMTVRSGSSFRTSSGDFRLTDTVVEDDVELDTSSGDIDLAKVTAGAGFEMSTSSGDVTVEDSHGIVEGHSSSGDVRIYGSELNGPSRFSSSSGDVFVRLAALPAYDLEASSSSGNVTLDVESFARDFRLILIKREDRGHIRVPFEYTSEDTFSRHGHTYVEKTVERGTSGPEIRLRTASGSIVVQD